MTASSLGLVIEGMVAILLIATIFYCIIVNAKLTRLRGDQSDLKAVIGELHQTTINAEAAVTNLRSTIHEAETGLEHQIDSARLFASELDDKIKGAENAIGKMNVISRAVQKQTGDNATAELSRKIRLSPEMRLSRLSDAAPASSSRASGRSRGGAVMPGKEVA